MRSALPLLVPAAAALSVAACKDSLAPDWAGAGPPRMSISAESRIGGVAFRWAVTTGVPVLYVSTSETFAAAMRVENPASPLVIGSEPGVSWHGRLAVRTEDGESDPTRSVSIRAHDILPAAPSWTFSGTQVDERAGYPVRGDCDVNGDGFADVLVGAYRRDLGLSRDHGAFYVFHGSSAGLAAVEHTRVDGESEDDNFAAGLACAGDLDSDGFDDVIAGAPDFASGLGLEGEGKGYVFLGAASGLSTAPDESDTGGQSNMFLGRFTGGAGDVNGDGFDDAVISAPLYDDFDVDEGAAFLLLGGALVTQANWMPSGDAGDSLGWSMAPRGGDGNGDGLPDILIGSEHAEGTQNDEGLWLVYRANESSIPPMGATWSGEVNQTGAHLGSSVAWGDVDGDGFDDVLAGGRMWNTPAGDADAGIVAVFRGGAAGVSALDSLRIQGSGTGSWLGEAVDSARVDGPDVPASILAGSPGQEGDAGRAQLFDGSGSLRWSFDGESGTYTGGAVAGAGDVNGDGLEDVLVGTIGRSEITPPETTSAMLFLTNPAIGPSIDPGIPPAPGTNPLGGVSVTGSISCTVDWGDGTTAEIATPCVLGNLQHTYAAAGPHDVTITAIGSTGLSGLAVVQVP